MTVHLLALVQGGRQHAEYRDHSHWLRDWDDQLQQLKASQEAMKRLQEEETHVDETHAGTVLATIYALQNKRDDLRQEVNELKKQRSAQCKKVKAIAKEVDQAKALANAAEEELQSVRDTSQQAENERDEARAAQQQAPDGSITPQPDQGTQQLKSWLLLNKSWSNFMLA